MSTAAHTPGPWKFIDASKVASYQYKSLCVIEAGDKQIASFSWNDNSPWFPTRVESQANARLIAAAPDLIAALKSIPIILDHMKGTGAWDTATLNRVTEIVDSASRAAIAKAEARP